MASVTIGQLTFDPYINAEEIEQINANLADGIEAHYTEATDLIAIVVLKGGYIFASDLLRKVNRDIPVYFIQLSSYIDTRSSGTVQISQVNLPSLAGKHVLIIEDIIESGLSMQTLLGEDLFTETASVELCTLLLKPSELKAELDIKFVGKEIPPAFVLGYGLDYNEYGRHLPEIYQLKK